LQHNASLQLALHFAVYAKQVNLICIVCLCQLIMKYSLVSCVDVDDGSSVEIVDEFYYLGDMLSVDGDVDAAVTVRKTWK